MVYTVIRFFFVYCLFLFLCEGMTLEDGLEESGVHMSLFVCQDFIYSNFMYSNVFCIIVLQDFVYLNVCIYYIHTIIETQKSHSPI